MSKQANSTLLALIPKKKVLTSVTEFRPISCSSIFYKTIAKILVNRLTPLLPHLMGDEQAAFVANRNIFENIMVSQQLVKSYNRKNISLRCLIKVDIRKTFDSIQWIFI